MGWPGAAKDKASANYTFICLEESFAFYSDVVQRRTKDTAKAVAAACQAIAEVLGRAQVRYATAW